MYFIVNVRILLIYYVLGYCYVDNFFFTSQKTSDIEEFAPRIVKALPTFISTTEGELTR